MDSRRSESGFEDDEDGLAIAPVAEINVTPLVDVMLVLLIVFMVAAPLMVTGVTVQLPRSAAAKLEPPKAPLVVSVDLDGGAFIGRDRIGPSELAAKLRSLAASDPAQVVLVRGDQGVAYGKVMDVVGQVGAAGFARVSLVTRAGGPGGP